MILSGFSQDERASHPGQASSGADASRRTLQRRIGHLQGLSLRLCLFIPPVYACNLSNAREISVGLLKLNILWSSRILREAVHMYV